MAYHPDRKFNPDFCRPEDLFIHGIVDENGQGGTCASMPVVYVAVAKRLGFPVSLVETKGHLFFRWEDDKGTTLNWEHPRLALWVPPDRFNVEGSGEGIAYYDDSFYIQWPEPWNEADAAHGRYLKSLTHVEAFASFLVQRAECFYEAGKWQQCIQSIEMARKLAPEAPRYEWLCAKRLMEWQHWRQQIIDASRMHLESARRPRDPFKIELDHAEGCQCAHCREARAKTAASQVPPHGDYCQCFHCKEARAKLAGIPPHGEYCYCHQCQGTRLNRAASTGMPAHDDFCQCAMCLERRMTPTESQPWNNPGWSSGFPF